MLNKENLILIRSVLTEMETPVLNHKTKVNNVLFNSISFEFKRTVSLSEKDKQIFGKKLESGLSNSDSNKSKKNKPGWKKSKDKSFTQSSQFKVVSTLTNSFDFFNCMLYSIVFSYLVFLDKKIKTSYTEKKNYRTGQYKFFLIGFNIYCKKDKLNSFFKKTSLMYLSDNLIPYINTTGDNQNLVSKNLDLSNSHSYYKSVFTGKSVKSTHHTNVFYSQLHCNNPDTVNLPHPYQKLIMSEFKTQFLVHTSSKNFTHNNQSVSLLSLNGLKFV